MEVTERSVKFLTNSVSRSLSKHKPCGAKPVGKLFTSPVKRRSTPISNARTAFRPCSAMNSVWLSESIASPESELVLSRSMRSALNSRLFSRSRVDTIVRTLLSGSRSSCEFNKPLSVLSFLPVTYARSPEPFTTMPAR